MVSTKGYLALFRVFSYHFKQRILNESLLTLLEYSIFRKI